MSFEPAEETDRMIAVLQRNNAGNVKASCRDVLLKWLAGNGRKPVTWATFIDILQDMQESTLAAKIKTALTSTV